MHCIHSALTFPQDSASKISSQKNPSIQRSSQPSISSIPNANKQDSRKNKPGRRVEEHLVTANLVLDKADAGGIPVWIIGLDLSKAFARVHWPALWTALVAEEIPIHLVWNMRSSLEICILCCNFTSWTMDPQDSRMEHERATETRATGLHLGNSAANVFDLERLWQLDYGGCCTWTLDANEAGFCSFHLA